MTQTADIKPFWLEDGATLYNDLCIQRQFYCRYLEYVTNIANYYHVTYTLWTTEFDLKAENPRGFQPQKGGNPHYQP